MKIKSPLRPKAASSGYVRRGLFLVSILVVAGLFWTFKKSVPPALASLEPVTIAASTSYAGTCPIFAAVDKGYFASEGIAITIQPHNSGNSSMEAALRGDANLATVADLPIMFAALRGAPVMLVASMFEAGQNYGIVGRKDSQISTPASLKGKRIGVTLRSGGHFVLASFLNRQQLLTSDVTLVDLQPEEFSLALSQGRVDAASTWEPHVGSLIAQLGANGVVFPVEGLYDGVFNLAGSRAYLMSHPGAVKKVVSAVVKGARFCKDSPEEAIELSAKAMKTDPLKLRKLWPTYRFQVALDQSTLIALEDEARWAIKNKLTERQESINFLNHIYMDAVIAVSPSTMTIIH